MSVISPEFYFLNKFPTWIYYLSRKQLRCHYIWFTSSQLWKTLSTSDRILVERFFFYLHGENSSTIKSSVLEEINIKIVSIRTCKLQRICITFWNESLKLDCKFSLSLFFINGRKSISVELIRYKHIRIDLNEFDSSHLRDAAYTPRK